MIHFALLGVRWRATFGFFALVAVFLFVDAGGFALAFLGAAALHELGHLLAMSLCGVRVRLIELAAGGMLIHRDERSRTGFSQEAGILLAGVGANLMAAVLLYLLGSPTAVLHWGALRFSAANSALALYHLLPVSGLDGGSLLELFCGKALGCRRGTVLAGWISVIFCGAAVVLLALLTLRRGLSPGILLLAVLFASALLVRRGDS